MTPNGDALQATSSPRWGSGFIDCLDSMSLATMNHHAALQTRVDRKYAVAPELLETALRKIEGHLAALEIDGARQFRYLSTYFDSPNFDLYLAAARGRPVRYKVRTRYYCATQTSWLEVKERQRNGQTVKARIEHGVGAEQRLGREACAFVGSYPSLSPLLGSLRPVIETRYDRATLACRSAEGPTQRITIDDALEWHLPNGSPVAHADGLLVVEAKSASAHPGPADRALWAVGARPLSVSKCAAGIALAHPTLPSNRWHRVIQRYFRPTSMEFAS